MQTPAFASAADCEGQRCATDKGVKVPAAAVTYDELRCIASANQIRSAACKLLQSDQAWRCQERTAQDGTKKR